jgi:hypothetical protein
MDDHVQHDPGTLAISNRASGWLERLIRPARYQ